MAVVLIAGGTGLIGQLLSGMLSEKGYEVVILTRKIRSSDNKFLQALWNPQNGTIDLEAIKKADYIINLAGEGVAKKRWTKKNKQEIADSRVKSTQLIVNTLTNTPNKVQAVIQASAMGWYGDDSLLPEGVTAFSEEMPAAGGFFGETCSAWEKSAEPLADIGKRLVILRIGLVLSRAGGALKEFSKPLKAGFAGILGNGAQVQSWIHIRDLCRMFIYAIEHNRMAGVYNAAAPQPVSNRVLVTSLAESLKGSFYLPLYIPSFLLKVMLGQMSEELLKSITLNCNKIRNAGFQFVFPSLESAIKELTGGKSKAIA